MKHRLSVAHDWRLFEMERCTAVWSWLLCFAIKIPYLAGHGEANSLVIQQSVEAERWPCGVLWDAVPDAAVFSAVQVKLRNNIFVVSKNS